MSLVIWVLTGCSWWAPGENAPPEERQCEHDKADGCFRRIPGGTYAMGAQSTDPKAPGYDPDALPEEGPVHEVTVAPFWIADREAPFAMWGRCVDQGACAPSTDGSPSDGLDSLRGVAAGLTWAEAKALCASIGARLPTEAEWELAARGTDGRRYPWGNDAPCGLGTARNRFDELPPSEWTSIPGCEGEATPHSPRGFSPYAIADMAWGHWEWVEDAYAPYPGAVGVSLATGQRVQRGGSWAAQTPDEVRSSQRVGMPPDARVFDVGVRCAW